VQLNFDGDLVKKVDFFFAAASRRVERKTAKKFGFCPAPAAARTFAKSSKSSLS
jgi:hypothetical protein